MSEKETELTTPKDKIIPPKKVKVHPSKDKPVASDVDLEDPAVDESGVSLIKDENKKSEEKVEKPEKSLRFVFDEQDIKEKEEAE